MKTKFSTIIIFIFLFVLFVISIYIVIDFTDNSNVVDKVPELSFSHTSGFYNHDIDLSISALEGTIYYTLDGSDPTDQSIPYSAPIHLSDASDNHNLYSTRTDVSTGFYNEYVNNYSVDEAPGYKSPIYNVDKCNLVKAIVYHFDGSTSSIKTASYFIDYASKSGYTNMNILSLSTDPINLFDYQKGIYVTGQAFDDFVNDCFINEEYSYMPFWSHWTANYNVGSHEERPAHADFFDPEGKLVLSQNCGISIHGEGSCGYNPKSLNLYSRDIYSTSTRFMADFWESGFFPSRITLTQGGDDYLSKSVDYLMASLCRKLDFDTMDYSPYILFLDGEYWGVYFLTEKYDSEYISYKYDVDSNDVIIVKNNRIIEGNDSDYTLYSDFYDYVINNDMSSDEAYSYLVSNLDLQSFIDYYAANIYIARTGDWPMGNTAIWRTRKTGFSTYSDSLWRYLEFDANSYGMTAEYTDFDSYAAALEDPFFNSIMNNSSIRNQLLDKILELSSTTFNYKRVNTYISDYRDLMDVPMYYNNLRFYGEDSYSLYTNQIDSIDSFYKFRSEYVISMVEQYR